MEEERPPTKEEIDELRERTKDFVAENGEGNVIFCRERFAKTVQIFKAVVQLVRGLLGLTSVRAIRLCQKSTKSF